MFTRKFFPFLCFLSLLLPVLAGTGRYRATWRDDPSTTMVIAWDQQSGSAPILYYDTSDHGTNTAAYAFQQTPDSSNSSKGMSNQFVRLTGLSANTVYYFVIKDSNSTSVRMKFRTAPDDDTPFTIVSGGDSRNNHDVRIEANQMVAKLKPLAVMFGGDYTASDTSGEWQDWMDHWQETITSDGRLIPIIAARGNHEFSNASVQDLFDSPQSRIYFALTLGDNMLRSYTLNSEDTEGGNQATWLESDLAANQHVTWRFAQYHKPMRPHTSSKSEGNSEYNAWAQLFYDYSMSLVVECDSHLVKSTWPIRPASGSGSDEGFIRDDESGTVYVGEGTWGAPLRSSNDSKAWTRETGSFNQFKWIEVRRSEVQIRTVRYENVNSVGEVNEANPYNLPSGIDIWGDTIQLVPVVPSTTPVVSITNPSDGDVISPGASVNINADAFSPVGVIESVAFSVEGSPVGTDASEPYSTSWTAVEGTHTITAVASDDVGDTASDSVTVQVGNNIPENLVLPANGGVLESFTSEYGSGFVAADLTNGEINEDGWASTKDPGDQEFVYSFRDGDDAILNDAVIYAGTGENGVYFSKDVEVWTSTNGLDFYMAAGGTLPQSNASITLDLDGVVANQVMLVITSGYRTDYWELGEFVVNGVIVPPGDPVPNVVGMTQVVAETAILGASFSVGTVTAGYSDTVAVGRVISTNPAAGTPLPVGSSVDMLVSLGIQMVTVPDVVGLTQASAEASINAAVLTVGQVSTAYSNTVPADNVISQSLSAGASVVHHTAVDLVVSLGVEPVIVPDVSGDIQATAVSTITAASLTVGDIASAYSAGVPAGHVITQSPAAGTSVQPGSSVDLVVSLGIQIVTVPDVVGTAQAPASSAIVSANLTVGALTTVYSITVPAGDVISQSLPGGTNVAAGTSIDLVVSLGEEIPENVVLPANGGVLESFTSEYGSGWVASDLTNGVTNEDGWASKKDPDDQEFVYSFRDGKNAVLRETVIYAGTGEGGVYFSKDVEVWASADGVNYTLIASGTLPQSNSSITLDLGDTAAKTVKLVITSGYRTDYWELGEFVVEGTIVN